MGRNIEKTCNICLKKIHSDNLNRHMKKHQHTENTGMAKIDIDAVVKELIDQQKDFKKEIGALDNNQQVYGME